jgi:hypothetical protein
MYMLPSVTFKVYIPVTQCICVFRMTLTSDTVLIHWTL